MAEGLQVEIEAINKFGQQAGGLSGHLRSLPGRYSELQQTPDFGGSVSTNFQQAVDLQTRYTQLLTDFVAPGTSNLEDLAKQTDRLQTGASKAYAAYKSGQVTDANAASQFEQILGTTTNPVPPAAPPMGGV